MDVSHAAFTPKKSHRTHPLATIALLTITMIHSAAGCDPVTFKSLYNYDINMVATELM